VFYPPQYFSTNGYEIIDYQTFIEMQRLKFIVIGLFINTLLTHAQITVYPEVQDQTITDWGYDIKQPGKAAGLGNARINQVFIGDGMSVLRLPVRARDAHPSEGVVTASAYADVIGAIQRVKAIKPSVKLFASLRLEGAETFNDWMVISPTDRRVVAAKLAIVYRDFLVYMRSQGITIDIFGIDNEVEFNGGDITPSKYKTIVDLMRVDARNGLFTMPPLLVAPETYGPNNAFNWLTTLHNNGWSSYYDIAGTHYYPHLRPLSSLTNFCNLAANKIKWNTEIHWDMKDDVADQLEAEEGLIAIFDGFDLGMTGQTWWNYGTGTDFRAQMNGELVRSTNNARVIDINDSDGRGMTQETKLNTRAFRRGNELMIWILNNRNITLDNHVVTLATGRADGTPTFTRWVNTVRQTGNAIANNNRVTLSIPAFSYVLLKINYTTSPVPVELVDFKGRNTEGGNLLTWRTASESQNSHFDIERSDEGNYFEKIGTVKGYGTTQIVQHYQFLDSRPKALQYYRLRQVDFDGKDQFSNTIALKIQKNELKITPSVSNQFLSVEMPFEQATAVVSDILGRIVLTQTIANGQTIDISRMATGHYVVVVEAKGSKATARFFK
jgi:hypothetical protein